MPDTRPEANSLGATTGDFSRLLRCRDYEFSLLERIFAKQGQHIVLFIGGEGAGKTELARAYAYDRDAQLFGRVVYSSASALKPLTKTIRDAYKRLREPLLIIVDNFELLGKHAEIELQFAAREFPNSNFVIFSRPGISLARVRNVSTHRILPRWEVVTDILLDRVYGNNVTEQQIEIVESLLRSNPAAENVAFEALTFGKISISELIALLQPLNAPGIVDRHGNPIRSDDDRFKQVIFQITEISDELIHILSNNPDLMYQLSPRKFEELVAELLSRQGYRVRLTAASKDGGKDIYAAFDNSIGSFMYMVECKRYAPDRPVGVELVRQLYGSIQVEKVTAGIITTTSYFTKGAKEFQSQVKHQMALRDYLDLQRWLRNGRR
jgi:restriction system protein